MPSFIVYNLFIINAIGGQHNGIRKKSYLE